MAKDENRCWPGYEPVKGKNKNEQGSCRPKTESKLTPSEKEFRGKRKRQLQAWKNEHPGSPTKAAQHLHEPGGRRKSAATKRTARKKRSPEKKR